MRAVEQTPWAQQRSAEHDSLCRRIVVMEEARGWKCEIEAPLGRGFCDVLCTKRSGDGQRELATIFEAKTLAEAFSGGDLIRQLKWYRAQLLAGRKKYDEIRMSAVFETKQQAERFRWMLEKEGIAIMWGEG